MQYISSFISYVIILLITLALVAINAVPGQNYQSPSFHLLFLFCLVLHMVSYSRSFLRKSERANLCHQVVKLTLSLDGNTPPAKTTITTDVDYQKRALIRAIIVYAIALPLMYFGFNRLLSKSEQQQQQLSSSSSAASQLPQFTSKSIPAGLRGQNSPRCLMLK